VSIRPRLLTEDDAIDVLKFFRYLAANEPKTFDNLFGEYCEDTQRYYWTGLDLRSWAGNPLIEVFEGIDLDDKRNGRFFVFLLEKAQEFQGARPTLLRHAEKLWHGQVQARQENQRILRRAAITAIVVRAAYEDTSNVIMSWDSMAKMIQGITGSTPGRQPLARLFEWLGSNESPFKVIHKGQRGKFRTSTTFKVTLPGTESWARKTNATEQKRTAEWLAGFDRAFSDLLGDEIHRRKNLPARKGRYARDAEIRAQLDQFGSLDLFVQAAVTPRNVQATSLSELTLINGKKIKEETCTAVTGVQVGDDRTWRVAAQRMRGTGQIDWAGLLQGMDFNSQPDTVNSLSH
jgi:hypothetical protein